MENSLGLLAFAKAVLEHSGTAFLFPWEVFMTKKQKQVYEDTEVLRQILVHLKGRKFRLDCGHHVTFGYFLGNNFTVFNGKSPKIICSLCGY